MVLLPGRQADFPFQAKCIATQIKSPLKKGETVEVLQMAPEEACEREMFVLIAWRNSKLAVPLAQLAGIKMDESTAEGIGDWQYWLAQGYCF